MKVKLCFFFVGKIREFLKLNYCFFSRRMELTQVRELAVNTITSNDMQENQDVPNSRVIPSSNESVNVESQVSNKY